MRNSKKVVNNNFKKSAISDVVDSLLSSNSRRKLTAGGLVLSLALGAGFVHADPVDLTFNSRDTFSWGSGGDAKSSFSITLTPNSLAYPADTWTGSTVPTLANSSNPTQSISAATAQSIAASETYYYGASHTASFGGSSEVLNVDSLSNPFNLTCIENGDAICNTASNGVGLFLYNDYAGNYVLDTNDSGGITIRDESLIVNVNANIFGGQYGIYVGADGYGNTGGYQGALTINNLASINGGRGLNYVNGAGISANGGLTYDSNDGLTNSLVINNDGTINGESYAVTVNGFSTVAINNTGLIGGTLLASDEPSTALNITNIGNFINTGGSLTVNVFNDVGTILGSTGINIDSINWGTDSVNNQLQGNVLIENRSGLFDSSVIRGTNGNAIQVSNIGGGLAILNDEQSIGYPGEDGAVIYGLNHGISASNINREVTIINGTGGLIYGEYGSGINLANTGAVTISNAGLIESAGSVNFGSFDDSAPAIRITDVTSGGVLINNSGSIIGNNPNNYQVAIEIGGADEGSGSVFGPVIVNNLVGGNIIGSGDALRVLDTFGSVAISNAGNITAGDDAIWLNFVDATIPGVGGTVTITNEIDGVMTAVENVVDLDTVTANVSIVNRGTMSASDDGFEFDNVTGNVVISNLSTGTLTASRKAFDFDNIVGNVTIENSGVITAGLQLIKLDDSVGNLTILNTQFGEMTGGIYVGDLLNGSVTVTNNGVWNLGTNSGNGSGSFYVDLDSPGTVTLNNAGTMNLRGYTEFNADTFTFTNSGLIDVTQDGNDFSTIEIYGDGVTTFASNGGRLRIDAALGKSVVEIGSASLSLVPESDNDYLFIDGQATGVTTIQVVDKNPTTAGVNNPTGSNVVRVMDPTTPDGNFVLANGPINKGLWQYDLYTDKDANKKTWRLASVPSSQAFELPQVLTAAQRMWYTGADALQERSQELRITDGKRANGGAWAKIIGSKDRNFLSNSYTLSGKTSNYNTDSDQNIGGVMLGADGAINLQSGGQWILGAMFGGVTGNQSFKSTGSTSRNDSATVGLYANYAGPVGGFVNFLIKGDMGRADYSMNNREGISAKQKISTNSLGGQIQTGYRFASPYAFIEPVASLATVSVASDNFNMLSTDVTTKGSSSRGSLGFNTGFTVPVGSVIVEPIFSARYVSEFDRKNTANLVSGGEPSLTLRDNETRNFGQYAFTLKLAGSKQGSYGYARIQHDAGSTTKSTSANLGMKVVW